MGREPKLVRIRRVTAVVVVVVVESCSLEGVSRLAFALRRTARARQLHRE